MRREFALNDSDTEDLEALGLPWETVQGSSLGRVIIHNFPVPSGYNHSKVDLNIVIEPAYPETQIDMVYFHPALARHDGKVINAIENDQFDGKCWQRWSRHRTGQNPWRPSIDNITSHLKLVEYWLKKELAQ